MPLRLILSLLLCVALCLAGCSWSGSPTTYTETIKVYYGSPGNERLVSETRTIAYSSAEDKYEEALKELFKGPKDASLVANISNHTKVLKVVKNGSDLTVNLDKNFGNFAGSVAEIVAVGSVVNTLVQFPEIERVKILVEGRELIGPSGLPRGFMSEFTNHFEPPLETRSIVLYFADESAQFVRPETRQIRVKPDISKPEFIRSVLLELISGPRNGALCRTIPHETNVRSVAVKNHTAYVDFSEEIKTRHWGGAAGEAMTINSITATLTEIPGIEKVMLTMEGQPLNIEHMVLDKPLTRNSDMIRP